MKKSLYSIFLAACIACASVSCSSNDPDESTDNSSSTGTNVDTNYGDDNDLVENQTWSYSLDIVWSGSTATVSGSVDGVTVSNSNGYVSITSTTKQVVYNVSGSGTGQLSIYSDYKFQLALQGLTLACSDGPAINNQCHKTCYVVVNGTNTLSDGSSYASSSEDRKAAFFSEGQLCFSGTGSLNITGNYKHALASDDYIRLCTGMTASLDLTAKVSDGLHTNDGVIINAGSLTITAVEEGIQCDTSSVVITGGTIDITSSTDKGILAYGNIEISSGTIGITSKYKCIKTQGNLIVSGGTITAIATGTSSGNNGGRPGGSSSSSDGTPEGIEAKGTITITGGQIYAQANDDAINSGSTMTISGGYVCAYSTGNDGLDANSNLYINGGLVYAIGASSPEVAIDALENCTLYINGGTLVAIGGLESGASLNQSCYSASSWSSSTWYGLTVGSNVFAFKTPSSGGTPMVVSGSSTPKLVSGVTASGTAIFNGMGYYPSSVSGGSSVSLSSYTSGSSGGGGTPGGGGDRPGGH